LAKLLAACEPAHWVPSSKSSGLVSTPLVATDQKPTGVLNAVGAAPTVSPEKSHAVGAVCAAAGTAVAEAYNATAATAMRARVFAK
jgi:hypothetical protein